MRQRNNILDYGRALAIIYMISVHLGFTIVNTTLIFAMPILFFISGYNYTVGKTSFKEFAKRRAKRLVIPFFICEIVFGILEIFRSNYYGYGDWRVIYAVMTHMIYGSGKTPGTAPWAYKIYQILSYKPQPTNYIDISVPSVVHLWFLPVMFTASLIFYLIIERVHNKKGLFIGTVIILCAAAGFETIPDMWELPWGLGRAFFATALMMIGYAAKESGFFEKKNPGNVLSSVAVSAVFVIVAYMLGSNARSLNDAYYGPYPFLSVYVTLIGAIGGICIVLQLMRLFDAYAPEVCKKAFSLIGVESMSVYTMHLLILFSTDILFFEITKEAFAPDPFYFITVSTEHWVFKLCQLILSIAILVTIPRLLRKKTQH